MKLIIALILLSALIFPSIALSEIITSQHTYVMGDNDTKNEARKLCLIEAKRKIVEEAGTYISSRTEVSNMQLNVDEIKAFSASVLKVKILNEKWSFVGQNLAVELTVQANIDIDKFNNKIEELDRSSAILNRMQEQYKRLQSLEDQINMIQPKLNNADFNKATKLRESRIDAIEEIDTIESKYGEIIKRVELRRKRQKEKTLKLAKSIFNFIEMDMTKEEVESLIGKPDKESNSVFDVKIICYIYKPFTIWFNREGLVEEVRFRSKGGKKAVIKEYKYNMLIDGIKDEYKRNPDLVEILKKDVLGVVD